MAARAPSPDSDVPGHLRRHGTTVGGGHIMSTTQGGGTQQVNNPGARKRIRRACDKCSKSRTRCDGDYPCLHCVNYGFDCSYDREERPRGRASMKRTRVDSISSSNNEAQSTANRHPSSVNPQVRGSANTTQSDQVHHQQINVEDPLNAHGTLSNGGQPGRGSQFVTNDDNIHNPRPVSAQQYTEYMQLQQDMVGAPNFQQFYFDDGSLNNFSGVDFYGNGLQAMPATIYSTATINEHGQQNVPPTPGDRPRTISRIGLVVPNTPIYRPQSTFGKSPSADAPSDCKYPVLSPLLPHISHIISPSIACHLLDLYFAEPSSSLFESASPYVLTHIFRKQSFLHPTRPRKTSKALLAAMLWATAQTSDASVFKTLPTSRARVCDRLFAVCLRFLNPLIYETPRRVSLDQMPMPERSHNGGIRDGMQTNGTVDDVITLTLIGVVISGGDFKHDCLKWWRATWALAKELKLNQEIEENPTVVTTPETGVDADQAATTNGAASKMTEESKEERRRIWWLLFIADRHLALSFNGPLHIFEAECHVYQPLEDTTWQESDPDVAKERFYGPQTTCTGVGLFEFFLPLMVILGDIVDIHHRSYHPRFGRLENHAAISQVEISLERYEHSLRSFDGNGRSPAANSSFSGSASEYVQNRRLPSIHQMNQMAHPLSPSSLPATPAFESRRQIVVAYSTQLLHVLYILLHGKWDPISMLDDLDNWTKSPSFAKCASHSVLAAEAVARILDHDPELSFMPYLFGIYLLHGSFILLLFADKMQIDANPTVRVACETMIRAHEACVATLNTEYQRNFRKVLRSALYDARGIVSIDMEDQRVKRREFLSLYRWANNGVGLAL